jgi:pectate lyase
LRKKKGKFKSLLLIVVFVLISIFLLACEDEEETFDFKIFDEINESIELPTETSTDISLPTTTNLSQEARLSWTSSNFRVITQEGKVIQPDVDTRVTLELFITIGRHMKTYEYEVLVKGKDPIVLDTNKFKTPAGYACLGVTSRENVPEENVYVVNNEIEFLDAYIESQNKVNVVIEITKDLNLGARYIGQLLVEQGKWDGVNPRQTPYLDGKNFRENTNLPENHPVLLENGVGQLIVDGRDGLMIYSKNGATISHLTTLIKGNSNNIVFRNLKLKGIWEWDEIDRGDYKALDWDFFTIEFSKNIWLDHLTFKTAYDGIVDVKGGVSNITLSWLHLDFTVDEFIVSQFDYLEENIQRYPFYRELRDTISKEDITTVAAGQKKGFNFGNTEGGPNFESITITMHNIYAKNLQDRFPRLRRGDVHVYNVVLDSEELQRLRHINMKVISQALVPTEQGAILMENSRIVGVREPIKTHQSSNLDPDFTGRFKVVNSEYRNHDVYYFGSSDDPDFLNPWKRSNQNVDYDLEFFFRSYETLPYEYELNDARDLTRVFSDNLVGAGTIEGFDWLEITGQVDPKTVNKGYKIDESKIEGLERHISRLGTEIPTFTPKLYNYYTNNILRVDREYMYYVDTSKVDINTPGFYDIEYTFILLHNEKEVKYTQQFVVYDPNLENEIYDHDIGRPFDNILDGSVDVYEANGTLYYLLSNNETETQQTVIDNGTTKLIDSTVVEFKNLDVELYDYIHFVVVSNDLNSKVFSHKIDKELVVEISTPAEFNAMLIDLNSNGRYYKLLNDIDFTDYELHYLNADNVFQGVFDGQGFTLKNLNRHAYGGGVFHTLKDAKIKDVTFDNILIDIHKTPIYDEETGQQTGWQNTSARAGVVAGQIKGGFGIIENVTIKNSTVKTENNYGAIVVGKVEGYSDAMFKNITVLDSKVLEEGEYSGGITAGVARNSTGLFEDIYVNGLLIKEDKNKMIGTIVGRAEVGVTVRRVIAMNVTHTTSGQIGGVLGKDDRKGQPLETNFEHVFIDLTPTIVVDTNGDPNRYMGNLVGNPDSSFGHVIGQTNVWGTTFEKGSSGINAPNIVEKNELTATWWETNFAELLTSGLWEVKDNLVVLKK